MKNLTLEISLKPFKELSESYIKGVCEKFFEQWLPLCRRAETVSVMIWASDGSEILEYKGNNSQKFEWCKYIGVAPNEIFTQPSASDPENISIHRHPYLYMKNPPAFTYKDLKNIINEIKKTGRKICGKKIRIGATFDPGPEFAKSDFKYNRHPEICDGLAFGNKKCFVCCYKTLKADKAHYAGFPKGIPENTPFGMFLGRQAKHFMRAMGYDYIWLSNGFGFGMETWGKTGAVFNGVEYSPEKCAKNPRDKPAVLEASEKRARQISYRNQRHKPHDRQRFGCRRCSAGGNIQRRLQSGAPLRTPLGRRLTATSALSWPAG